MAFKIFQSKQFRMGGVYISLNTKSGVVRLSSQMVRDLKIKAGTCVKVAVDKNNKDQVFIVLSSNTGHKTRVTAEISSALVISCGGLAQFFNATKIMRFYYKEQKTISGIGSGYLFEREADQDG